MALFISETDHVRTSKSTKSGPRSIDSKHGRFFQSGCNDRTGPGSVPAPVLVSVSENRSLIEDHHKNRLRTGYTAT